MENTTQPETQEAQAPVDAAPADAPTPNDLAAKATPKPAPADPAPAHNEQPETFDRAYVEKLRKEAAEYRTKAKAEAEKVEAEKQDLIQQLGKALGFVKDEEPVDQAALIEQAKAESDRYRNELTQLRTENAITKAATSAGADTDILIPFLKGKGLLDSLDTTADDYASQVEKLVADTVNANPKFRLSAQPTASGVDTTGAPSADKHITRDDLAQLAANGQWARINELAAAGKLNHL